MVLSDSAITDESHFQADETRFHFHQERRVEEEVGSIWDAGMQDVQGSNCLATNVAKLHLPSSTRGKWGVII